jgi:hypothetical protein
MQINALVAFLAVAECRQNTEPKERSSEWNYKDAFHGAYVRPMHLQTTQSQFSHVRSMYAVQKCRYYIPDDRTLQPMNYSAQNSIEPTDGVRLTDSAIK